MSPRYALLAAAGLCWTASPLTAATWTILPDGSGDAPTIQAGVDSAAVGDTVLVACGTYFEQNVTLKSGILLTSETGAPCVTVDAESVTRCVVCVGVDSTTTVRGIAWIGGTSTSSGGALHCEASTLAFEQCAFQGTCSAQTGAGGGALVYSGSAPRFSDCEFSSCHAAAAGGAVFVSDSSPLFENCRFTGNTVQARGGAVAFGGPGTPRFDGCRFESNTAGDRGGAAALLGRALFLDCTFVTCSSGWGGAVYCEAASPEFATCVFDSNSAVYGGAVYCLNPGTPQFLYCLFRRDRAQRGGGLYVAYCSPVLQNCTLVREWATTGTGGGFYVVDSPILIDNTIIAYTRAGGPVMCGGGSIPTLQCCDVYGNSPGNWMDCIAPQGGSNGNFSTNPMFCDPEDDYHLRPCSPCWDVVGCGQVGALGPGCGNVLTVPTVLPTIADAMTAACVGDTVELECGLYQEHDLAMKSGVVLRSVTGDPYCVTIDAQAQGRVLSCVDSSFMTGIQGITFVNGLTGPSWPADGGGAISMSNAIVRVTDCRFINNESGIDAGAVLCRNGSLPYFENCEFRENSAFNSCGALYLVDCPSTEIVDCNFTYNSCSTATGYGGALMAWNSPVTLTDCRFGANWGLHGGALRLSTGSDAQLTRCVLDGNVAMGQGAALFLDASTIHVTECTFWGNGSGPNGGCIALNNAPTTIERTIIARSSSAVECFSGAAPAVSCSDFWDNPDGDWVGCLAGQAGVNGNFSADPMFCDAAFLDFTLTAGSPCLPGYHPQGANCSVVGAFGEGCPNLVNAPGIQAMPAGFRLRSVAPNPFSAETVIRYELPGPSRVHLGIFDVTGRLIRSLVEVSVPGGFHAARWDGRDASGRVVASGVYFCRLEAGDRKATTKIVRIAP